MRMEDPQQTSPVSGSVSVVMIPRSGGRQIAGRRHDTVMSTYSSQMRRVSYIVKYDTRFCFTEKLLCTAHQTQSALLSVK